MTNTSNETWYDLEGIPQHQISLPAGRIRRLGVKTIRVIKTLQPREIKTTLRQTGERQVNLTVDGVRKTYNISSLLKKRIKKDGGQENGRQD